jgi:hypothetical protein
MKKTIVLASALALICGGAALVQAEVDKGPADITMTNPESVAKQPKPAVFPHAKHQERLACGDCHHGKDDAGKQVPYTDGQKIEKCITCHTGDSLAGKDKGKSALHRAGHLNCKKCHTEEAKKDEAKKELKKCSTCHPKAKK